MSWMRETDPPMANFKAGTALLVTQPVTALDQISCAGRCPPAWLR